jgi:hypothetical protein
LYDLALVMGVVGCLQKAHTKRQATQHGCLPGFLDIGDTGIEIVYDEEKNILYWTD